MKFHRIWTVMRAELAHIRRDPVSLIVALFMPFFMLFLFGYSLCLELRDLPVAVFDLDQSQESRKYIDRFDNTSYFDVRFFPDNYDLAVNYLDSGKTRLVIIIPSGFSRKISENRPARIQALVDASFVNSAQFIVNYISGINAAYSGELASEFLKSRGIRRDIELVQLACRSWHNQSLRDFTFIITGLFSVVIMGFVPILSALAIVREKESGSIQQIFSSPIKAYEYIAGKMAPYVIFLTIDNLLVLISGIWWFDLPFRGNVLTLLFALSLFIFATVAIGFFISTLTKNQLTAMLLAVVFTLMPAFIFGDAITPLKNMPEGWQLYSCLFPARFFTGVSRAVLLKGAAIQDYWEDMASLFAYCVVIFAVSSWRLKGKTVV
ncbi:MAG: ABC transporter permease [Thermodesulfobacteriota bacterium]|nr:ABC transporter permease [Thermodesulfobacteriota bacterium]